MTDIAQEPWYKDGLRFECTKCGDCCHAWEGGVWLVGDDVSRLAKYLSISEDEVIERYTNKNREDLSIQRMENGACPLFKMGEGCTVHEAKPNQCSSFPFMRLMQNSREDWDKFTHKCPGANQGKLISADEITRRIKLSIKF